MKKLSTLIILVAITSFSFAQETVVFHEGFEGGVKPDGWIEQKVIGLDGSPTGSLISWKYLEGGYGYDPDIPEDRGYPDHAAQGDYNAMFQLESYNQETTKLITPPIDLSDVIKPELRFAHAQATWYFNNLEYNDKLKIYYKRGLDSAWVLMQSYEDPVENWITRSIQLPDSSLSSTYYIAFEGITGFGYGTCIDTVRIMETGVISKYLDSYSIQQASTDFIPTNTTNNPILKIILKVEGNDGSLFLDSLKVTSLNTDDNNLANNGVKLYATEDSTFKNAILIGSGINFINGIASFKNLNYDLRRGITSIWVTYDIDAALDHDIHNSIVDAKIKAEGIYINGSAFPFADKSPDGERLLKEAIFNDTFESPTGWILNGSFERDTPQGLGALYPGNTDPENAYNGSFVLGTDLTVDGVYANNLTNRKDSAVSPTFNSFYYKDVTLYFVRWLNIEFFDNCYIDISSDNGTTWSQLWKNPGSVTEYSWSTLNYDLNQADFKENVKIRFGLGTTNAGNQYTGWNIDDFIIVGDFISKDVGISSIEMPETGCGHTTSDDISVYIENFAGEATQNSIPLRYSIDGSTNYTVDAHPSSLEIGDSTLFTFSVGANLSTPGYHTIKVETTLSGDEISSNNSKTKTIFSYPTLTLPYSQNFETNNGYYLPGGNNSSWAYGTPSLTNPVINSAASGTKAWLTNLSGSYLNNDSSFLESPCFDFTGSDSIVFEFKCKGLSEDKTDGLTLLYSLDQGGSWVVVPNDNDFYWNWYNETLISELELPGIDSTDNSWLTFRQLLPPELSNESSVKFRFAFESNASLQYEGFGIDDIKVYDAPYDVGVSSLDYPFTDCEWKDTTHVKIYVENYGITDVKTGTKIPLVMKFNSLTIKDTLTLESDLLVEDSVLFTFNSTVDMSYAGAYNFIINTKLESNTFFYNQTQSNDSLYATVSVIGMPRYDIGWIVGSDDLDTLLDAGQDAGVDFDFYSWYYLGSEVGTSRTYQALAEGIYYVTVTNDDGCVADDSLKVVSSLIDVKMDSIRTVLKDSCQRFELTEIRAAISNLGQHFIDGVNDTILFGYQVNNLPEVYDILFLDGRDLTTTSPYDTISFTFGQKCDLRAIGEYTLRVFTNFANDLNRTDDVLYDTINTWGLPSVNLAFDTIYSSQADTLTLDAGSGFASYLWNPGDSTTQTITPINSSYYYKVTVTDIHTCGSDKDSTYIETHDLGISEVLSPANICEDFASSTTALNIEITNYSGNIYSSENIKIFYEYDEGPSIEVNPILNVGASGVVTLNNISTIDATDIREHTIKIYISSDIDVNHNNDTLEYTFSTWPEPHVNLAYDTIFTTKADTVLLIAQEGFISYNWNDGTTNDTLFVSKKYSKKYIVTVTDEHCGTASDSTQIITYNLGVASLVSPLSACEHVTTEKVIISIKNYSNDTLKTGSVIPVGYILNGLGAVNENFTLSTDLLPLKTINYTFATRANLSAINTYNFEVYTALNLDVVPSNDTLIDVIKTFGYPSIELGNDISTTQPDTVIIVAAPGFKGYFWDDGTKNDTLIVSYPASKLYSITVNDINGCIATDEINVFTYNVAASELVTPFSQCELSAAETVSFDVINSSLDTLLTGETINVSYTLNSGSPVNESFNLSGDLLPGVTTNYTFTQTANLSANQTHEFDLFAERASIDVETDDAITRQVIYQKPILDLGPDVNTGNTEYTIDAGLNGTYESYLWFDNSTSRYFTVDINDQNPNHYYAVEVTNSYACTDEDSVQVTFTTTPDLAVTSMTSPVSDCWNEEEAYPVHIIITNSGVVNLNPGASFTVGYRVDGGTAKTETFNLSAAMDAGDTREHTFADEISFSSAKIYKFKPFVKLADDGNVSNDTLATINIDISAPEVILGANDTISFTSASYEISTSESYLTYLWNDGSTEPTLVISETGSYSVTVTDQYGCQGVGSIYCKKITTGIDHIIQGDGYQISYYPNPASEKLMIQIDNQKSTDIMIEIVSSSGQVLYINKLSDVENSLEQIDVTPYARGVYYFKFKINDEVFIRKIILQ